jgi:hypothetical protein
MPAHMASFDPAIWFLVFTGQTACRVLHDRTSTVCAACTTCRVQHDINGLRGLQGMVRVAVDQFLAGTDLFRLQLQQSMAGVPPPHAACAAAAADALHRCIRLLPCCCH